MVVETAHHAVVALALALALSFAFAFALTFTLALAFAFAFAFALSLALSFALSFAFALSFTLSFAFSFTLALAFAFAFAFAFTFTFALAFTFTFALAFTFAFAPREGGGRDGEREEDEREKEGKTDHGGQVSALMCTRANLRGRVATSGSIPVMMTVGSLVSRATTNPGRLATELAAWVLVGPPPANEDNEWSFRTLSARTVRDADGVIEAILDDTYLVLPLKKAQVGPFASTILVGRSRTNDVCVSHSSVSKLHARIRIVDGKHFLSDAGSSNGTSANGTKVGTDVEVPLSHGTLVRFGACNFQVFEPVQFTALLAKFAKGPMP